MRPLLSLVASAVLLLALLCCGGAAQSIVKVSGCTDVGAVTVNCTFPAILHLTVSNYTFKESTILNLGLGVVVGSSTVYTYGLTLDANDPSNSTVVATINSRGYQPAIMALLIKLVLINNRDGLSTPPFAGVEFAYEPPPTLTSISGCQDGPGGTFNCVPDQTVLTIRGENFKWLQIGAAASVCIESKCSVIPLTVVNSSYVAFPLSERYVLLVEPQHYGGGVLSLYFDFYVQTSHYYTNALNISIAPLPLPVVQSWSSIGLRGCEPSDSGLLPNFTSCIPFHSVLVLDGQYMSAAVVTVAGLPCLVQPYQDRGSLIVRLPVFPFVPLLPYDLVVTNPTGSWVGTGAITFTAAPAVYAITKGEDFSRTEYYASPGGFNQQNSTIVVYGVNFYADPTLQVRLAPYSTVGLFGEFNMTCDEPTWINSTAISCHLPVLNATAGPKFWGLLSKLTVTFNSSQVVTPQLVVTVYDYPTAPQVQSVTGCRSAVTALQLSGCANGAVLTLTGLNFGVWNATDRYIQSRDYPAFRCAVLPGGSPTLMRCALDPDYPIVIGQLYVFTLHVSYLESAFFRITFAADAPPSTGGGNGSSNGAIILTVVLCVTLPLLAVLAGVTWWKRKQCKELQERLTSSSTRASDEVDVEMS
jgi:hypothetical protein